MLSTVSAYRNFYFKWVNLKACNLTILLLNIFQVDVHIEQRNNINEQLNSHLIKQKKR